MTETAPHTNGHAPADDRPWDPLGGPGSRGWWQAGMPQPEPQGNWQRMALQPPAMGVRTAATIAVSAAARSKLQEAVALLEAGEQSLAEMEARRDGAWRAALGGAFLRATIVPASAADDLLAELERRKVITLERDRDAFREAWATLLLDRADAYAADALARVVEILERTAPGLLADAPETAVSEVSG